MELLSQETSNFVYRSCLSIFLFNGNTVTTTLGPEGVQYTKGESIMEDTYLYNDIHGLIGSTTQ